MKTINILASLVIAASLAAVACDDYDNTDSTATTPSTTDTTPRTTTPAPSTTTPPAADNTERNRNDTDPTALNQGQGESDIRITAEIRRAIMEDTGMSINAQNCKVITQNGVVTLRGPVASQAEKDAIGAKAEVVAGVTRVDNQLEVKTP
jgi:hyperosmotically inducible protein